MNRVLTVVLIFSAAVPLGFAAESAGDADAGRDAKIHLRDGVVVKCVVLGFADGSFQIKRSGQAASIPIDNVERVEFGKAVGEFVRNPFVPPAPRPTTQPATAKPPDKQPRPIEDLIRSLGTRQLVVRLAHWTDRYRDRRALERTEAGVRRMLAARPERGPLDKNLKFLLVLLKTAQGEMRPAKHILDELKRGYAKDEVIQNVEVPALSARIERIKRPGRMPRPPDSRRPLRRERDRARPRPDAPPE
jgi:hypothetical protein